MLKQALRFGLWGVALTGFLAIAATDQAFAQVAPPGGGSSASDDRDRDNSRRVPDNVALFENRRPEYVVSGPIADAEQAEAALEQAGAVLVSFRDLAPLDRRVMIFDLRNLALETARQRLAQAAPAFLVDFNHLYTYAQGAPRVYAATLIGDPATVCRVGRGQRLGLIDGPVQENHPALRQADIVVRSALARGQTTGDSAHGTAVAALMVGEDPAGYLNGFAAGARLYAINAFALEQRSVAADVDRIGAALTWLLSNNVRLINMSFAGPQNVVLADLLAQSEGQGAIMIAAAGNTGRERALLPASAEAVVAVTAVDASMRRYRAATRGSHIEFAAPGVDVYVAQDGGGGYATGTSYAAPIVTALAARMTPNSVAELRGQLRNRVMDLGDPGHDAQFGWGLVRNIGC